MEEVGFLNFNRVLESEDYKIHGRGERHGSQETTWGKEKENEGGFVRLVTVSVTPPPGDAPTYGVEVHAGAVSDKRYVRYVVRAWGEITEDFLYGDAFGTMVGQATQEAMHIADSLHLNDLVSVGQPGVQTDIRHIEHLGEQPSNSII